jgi:uncharacterized protein (DUF885 family)
VTHFDTWAETFSAEWVRANPLAATVTQYFDGAEQDALDRKLAPGGAYGETIGLESARAKAVLARRGLAELAAFPRRDLAAGQRTSAAMLERRLRDAVANAEYAANRPIFNQFNGLHVALVSFLTTLHPLRNERDAENYVERLAQVEAFLDRGIAEASAAPVPPRFILERTIAQLRSMTAGSPRDHALVTTLERAPTLARVATAAERDAFVERAGGIVTGGVVPALERVRAFLEALVPRSSEDAGISRLPDGAAFYQQQLAHFTGSSMTPHEIHETGLREVARIEGEMDAILRRLGHTQGSIKDRVAHLNRQIAERGPGDVRPAIIARLRELVDDAVQRSRAVFNVRPRAPVTVEREPAHSEATAAAHYSASAADGSKPGIYWVPLADLGPSVPWLGIGMKSTAYHEAVPGHHFQFAIEQESATLPYFRKRMAFGYDVSFGEGWALYAEHLAAEFHWYEDDLIGLLGYFEMQLFRARRLVVDTGLHAFGWTRRQAIDYGLSVPEVERYVVWPGQACAYMLGQHRLLDMRDRARTALGDGFSLAAFHDLVLTSGSLPLDVLSTVVDEWIDAEPERGCA